MEDILDTLNPFKAEEPEVTPTEEVVVAVQDPELPESPLSDIPAKDACISCLGTGLIGDPALPGNKVCSECAGTGRKS